MEETALARLVAVGFRLAGHWEESDDDRPALHLDTTSHQSDVLYTFVVSGEVRYVGKSTSSLKQRLSGYRNPGPTQSTNVRIAGKIREVLSTGVGVEIYAFADDGRHGYGGFHLNLAAGLEDSIIRDLKPEWNDR